MRDQRTARRFEMVVPMMGWGSSDRCFDGWTRNVSTSGVYLVANRRSVRIEPNCEGGSACVGIAAVVEQYTLPPRMHVAFATLGADAPDSARN
jgi:hypothetical protein